MPTASTATHPSKHTHQQRQIPFTCITFPINQEIHLSATLIHGNVTTSRHYTINQQQQLGSSLHSNLTDNKQHNNPVPIQSTYQSAATNKVLP
uniref:Uncharacterized protein n=1 Tax=Manihot esculenta TaxID=3983 RepID=A0A2C9V7E2_MANES